MLKIILVLCGLIHAIPVAGVLGPDWLEKLYGVSGLSVDTVALMQHRAILFGIVALLCFQGAFNVIYRNLATLMVIVSMSGYLWLIGFNHENPKLLKVLWIDTALMLLLIFSWLWEYKRAKHSLSTPNHSD